MNSSLSSKDNKKTISGTQDVLDSAIMWITFLASTIPGPRKKKGKSRPGINSLMSKT